MRAWLCEPLCDGERDCVAVGVAACDPVADEDNACDAVGSCDGETDGELVGDAVLVCDRLRDWVREGVWV